MGEINLNFDRRKRKPQTKTKTGAERLNDHDWRFDMIAHCHSVLLANLWQIYYLPRNETHKDNKF